MTITTRAANGSELTHNELDANFTDLDLRTGVVYGPASEYTGTYAGGTGPTAAEIADAVWAKTLP